MAEREPDLKAVLSEAGAGLWTLWQGVRGLPTALSPLEPFSERRLAQAMASYVWRPAPMVFALCGLIGATAGILCASVLKRFHVELTVIPPLVRALVAQVAPLIVGIFAAGRVSVALAARFGAMQVRGEMDGLVLRGREPVRDLLGPVMVSMLVAAPVLTVIGALAALLGAGLVLRLEAVTPMGHFVQLTVTQSMAQGALNGVVRSCAYLALAVMAGAAAGTAPIEDLPKLERQTTAAFTSSLLMVFAASALLAPWT